MKVFISYKLLPTASVESFEKWSREVDQPTLLEQPAVSGYQVFKVRPDDESAPAHYLEEIDVESGEAWDRTLESPPVVRLLKEWESFCDGDSIVVQRAEPL